MLWYSSEGCRQGTSDEYPQHRFSWRNKKKIWGYPSYLELSINLLTESDYNILNNENGYQELKLERNLKLANTCYQSSF